MKILKEIFIGFLVMVVLISLLILLGDREESNLLNPPPFSTFPIVPLEEKADTWEGIHLGYCAYDPSYGDDQYQWLGEQADFLIFHEGHQDKLPLLKETNPKSILLCYKANSAIKLSFHKNIGDYFEINQHEDWFLHDRNGRRVTDVYDEFTRENVYLMDPGNPKWRAYASEEMLKVALAQEWDGIFLDVLHVDIGNWWAPGGLKEYSTDEEFNEAVLGFLEYLHQKFKANNKLLILNGAEVMKNEGLFRKWLGHSDGITDEGFVNIFRWGREKIWEDELQWEREISGLEYAGEKEKLFFAMSHNRGFSQQDLLYNLASYLMGKKNNKAFFYNGAAPLDVYSTYSIHNYLFDYSLFTNIYAAPIGYPLNERYKKEGIWQRDFSNGKVLVNPSYQGYVVNLGGTYRTLDETEVDKILLGPHEGTILLK